MLKGMALPAIITAFTISAFAAQNASDVSASVRQIGGTAQYSRGGGGFMPLDTKTTLRAGDVVRTGPGSYVNLDLGRVGRVQVAASSTVGIDRIASMDTGAERVTETQLDLRSGALYAKVNKLSRASRYEIKTARGIAGVRGTEIYITADGCLSVDDGSAGMAYVNNGATQTFVLNDDQTICFGDAGPRPTPAQIQQDIDTAVASLYGPTTEADIAPRPPIEPFVSPTLPGE